MSTGFWFVLGAVCALLTLRAVTMLVVVIYRTFFETDRQRLARLFIETQDLAVNAATQTYVGTGTTDFAITAGAAYADVTGATVTFTPFSSASEIVIMAVAPIAASAGLTYFAFARVTDGTAATIYHESGAGPGPAANNQPVTVALLARVTGLTGSQTFKMQTKVLTNNCVISSSSTDRKAQLVVIEHKR